MKNETIDTLARSVAFVLFGIAIGIILCAVFDMDGVIHHDKAVQPKLIETVITRADTARTYEYRFTN